MPAPPELARFLRGWYCARFTKECIPLYPVYAVMFVDHGVDPLGVGLLLALWAATATVAEVPSGVLADRLPRRNLIIAGSALNATGYACWWLWPSFAGFALGFALWGTGSACRSGSQESLLHDVLAAHGVAPRFTRVWGRTWTVGTVALVVALAGGGELAGAFGYGVVIGLSILMELLTIAIVAVTFPVSLPSAGLPQRFGHHLLAGMTEVRSNRTITFLFLVQLLLLGLFGAWEEFVGPWLDDRGVSLAGIGWAYAAIFVARGGATWFAERSSALPAWIIFAAFAASSLLLALAPFAPQPVALALLCIYFAVQDHFAVVLAGRLQCAIAGDSRATVTSVVGMASELGVVWVYLVYGAVAGSTNYGAATLATGLAGAAIALWLASLAHRWAVLRQQAVVSRG